MMFNSTNVSSSAAKTARKHNLVRNGKVLFDFSNVQDAIPEKILEEIRARIVESDTGILNDLSMVTYADHDEGIMYSVLMEHERYSVYDNARDRKAYDIKSAYAMKLIGYRMNAYGVVPNSSIPEICIESGNWTESFRPIRHIEI